MPTVRKNSLPFTILQQESMELLLIIILFYTRCNLSRTGFLVIPPPRSQETAPRPNSGPMERLRDLPNTFNNCDALVRRYVPVQPHYDSMRAF